MRTLIILVIGAILSVGFVYAANAFVRNKSAGVILFLVISLIVCAIDFASGVKAGYSAAERAWNPCPSIRCSGRRSTVQ
jgi:hypothetical protein